MTPDQYRREGAEAMRASCVHAVNATASPIVGTPYSAGGRAFSDAIRAIDVDEVLARLPPAPDPEARQMKVLIVGGPNRGQVVDVEATPSNMLELVQVRDPVRGEAYWFKVEADVQDKHEYVMRELCRAYEYLMKGETHRQHVKKNGKL